MFGDSEFFQNQIENLLRSESCAEVDVLVHSTNGYDDQNDQPERCREQLRLTDQLWLCRLPDALAERVYDACESPGVNLPKAHRQYGQLYTIATFLGTKKARESLEWDADKQITRFLTFSQLVHPTSIGFGNTAKLRFNHEGSFTEAVPGPCRGITEGAFIIPPHRNWLSKSEADQAKDLFLNSNIDQLPEKVARPHWAVQHAAFQYYYDVKAMVVFAGLESLINTKRFKTGEQFKKRTLKLAHSLQVNFTQKELDEAWDHRSKLAHGKDPWAARRTPNSNGQPPELTKDIGEVNLFLQVERLLRTTVMKCLTDQEFAKIFISDDSVERYLGN